MQIGGYSTNTFCFDRHELVVQLVRRLGYALGIRGYNDLRLRLAEMAFDLSSRINNPQELGRALITNQAWVYFIWAEYEKSLVKALIAEVRKDYKKAL